MVEKSTQLQVTLQYPKRRKFAITDMPEKPVNFLLYDTGVAFSSGNEFANFVSFVKVSVPVQLIIPWLDISVEFYYSFKNPSCT